ncbi:MAG TPA: MBL fold metallo-hydrolase [Bacillota bacterium]|nr:MBL fold metallo-hydrolase [Bacillota bacterium]HQC35776.1 MBL fold metallo-hydrolase [Bacillota bacterium]
MQDRVYILGTRGSVPVSGREFIKYGGASTCVVLRLAGETLVLDAGSGMLRLPGYLREGDKNICLLLSHSHADHIIGLPMCPCSLDSSFSYDIYLKTREQLGPKEQLGTLLQLPIWPVGPDELPASFNFHELKDIFTLGEIEVRTMEGDHPGGCSLMRLSGNGKIVVFATDSVINDGNIEPFTAFAKGCDLLMIDGQYSQEEFDGHPNFGHNSYSQAALIGRLVDAKKTLIIHHSSFATDEQLDAAGREVLAINPRCEFAREGQEVAI